MRNQVFLLFAISFLYSITLQAQNFAGKYKTIQNGVECMVEFKQTNQQVTGQVSFDNEKGALKGSVANGIATGTITDATTQQVFKFEAEVTENVMLFIMYVKNEDSDVSVPLTFQLERSKGAATQSPAATTQQSTTNTGNPAPAKAPKKPRDAKLLGIWRTTETINSGSGEFYMGMSTDYFMQFTQEGVAGVWQGKSAGGGASSSFSNEGDSEITQLYWYTEPSFFALVDPNSKEEVKTKYQFHDGQLVTTNQNGKYVFWTKVQ